MFFIIFNVAWITCIDIFLAHLTKGNVSFCWKVVIINMLLAKKKKKNGAFFIIFNVAWITCIDIFFLAHLAKGNVSFLPSLGVRRPLTFHILIFSSETSQPNETWKEASMEGPL